MGNVVMQLSMSLDGRFEGPGQDLSWGRVDDEVHTYINGALAGMRAFVSGRVNWTMMDAYWPTADQDPEATAPMREFASIWRDTPKIVVSRTMTTAPEGAELWSEVTVERVRALTAEGNVAIGAADLATSFLRLDLLDELRLLVAPVVLGAGRALFPEGLRSDWDLAETHAFGSGVVLLRYLRQT